MTQITYRKDIDGLRFLAVVPVVLGHAGIAGFSGGFIGVDIFFVISGFLITRILAREIAENRFSILQFYERRARRILPAISVVLLACLSVGAFILLPQEFVDLGQSTVATLLFASNAFFWISATDYFADGVAYEPLLHTWSLAVEEQFYVVFPILLWMLARSPHKFWIITVAAICAASLALSVYATSTYPTANFYLTPTRVWELGAGALLALGAFPPVRSRIAREVAGFAGLGMIIGSITLLDEQTPFPGLTAIPPVLGSALLIWCGMTAQPQDGQTDVRPALVSRLLSLAPFVGIGLISYSLYLWHWPLLVFARLYEGSVTLSAGAATLCIAVSFVLAYLSWRFVEQPFRSAKTGVLRSQKSVFVTSIIAMGLLGVAASGIILTKGAPSRLDPQVWSDLEEGSARHPLGLGCIRLARDSAPCPIGEQAAADATSSLIVWGDSHAAASLSGFDELLLSRSLQGTAFVRTACAPLLGVRRSDTETGEACAAHNEAVSQQIVANHRGSTVVLVARWPMLVEGERAFGEAGSAVSIIPVDGAAVQREQYPALVQQGLMRTVEELRAADIDVIMVAGIPEPGFNVPKLLARQQWLGWQMPVLPAERVTERSERTNNVLRDVAQATGATVVYPEHVMCRETCLLTLEGRPLYRDDDHLSGEGADWLVQQLFSDRAFNR